jgi:hypothetical protein
MHINLYLNMRCVASLTLQSIIVTGVYAATCACPSDRLLLPTRLIGVCVGALQLKVLVEGGANVSAQDRWGSTPLDEARRVAAVPAVELLAEAAGGEGGGSRYRPSQAEGMYTCYMWLQDKPSD